MVFLRVTNGNRTGEGRDLAAVIDEPSRRLPFYVFRNAYNTKWRGNRDAFGPAVLARQTHTDGRPMSVHEEQSVRRRRSDRCAPSTPVAAKGGERTDATGVERGGKPRVGLARHAGGG